MKLAWTDFLALLFIVVVMLSRLINLTRIPLFVDEGLYCHLGYQMGEIDFAKSLYETVFHWRLAVLLPLLNAVAIKILPMAPLVACRVTVIIASALGAIGFWLATKLLFNDRWAALVGLMAYLVNPYATFLDRTNLMEPVLVAALMWYMWSTGILAQKYTFGKFLAAVGSGLLVVAAKQHGVVMLLLPVFLWQWKKLRTIFLVLLPCVAVWILLRFNTPIWNTAMTHISLDLASMVSRTRGNLWLVGNWLVQYMSWFILPVLALGCWRVAKSGRWAWLMMPILLILMLALTGLTIFPRYLAVLIPFAAILVGWVGQGRWGKLLAAILLGIFVIRDVAIILRPVSAKIAREDHYQFFEDWSSGDGTKVVVKFLDASWPGDVILLVPDEIEGLWYISQLSFANDFRYQTNFYTQEDLLELIVKYLPMRKVWLVTTAHQWETMADVRSRLKVKLLMASHDDQRKSVRLEEVVGLGQ